jgi:polyketide synthase PksN
VKKVLVRKVAAFLKVSGSDIELNRELSEYGFDSISLTVLSNELNQRYQISLSPTIFFEYPTLDGFAGYLTREYREQVSDTLHLRVAIAEQTKPTSGENRSTSAGARRGRRRRMLAAAGTHGTGPSALDSPIAIIGVSGCFPQADTIDDYWENLKAGKSSITQIPSSRWDWQAIYGDPTRETNKTNIKWGGFIEAIDEFDPLFFGISPREAELMDPQQRLLMTHTWKAIEDAGYAPPSLSGTKTGIFVGTGSSGYSEQIARSDMPIEGHSSTGVVPSIGPNRMSYLLNLHGPSEPIETACSSSLVAIHRAVRAMRSGDCEMALVGGINTIITPWVHISFTKAGMLSEDGRCKTFSKDADGYVRGEGVGILLLKKLSAAQHDGDHIYALIVGSAQNHGGRASSLTAPNPKAQAELIQAAYREAQIDPRSVTYIETHGTGTPLGDPIEIDGLKSAFADLYRDEQLGEGARTQAHCGIGSVKTNIGHLEMAAGVAGVIKVLLQLKHRTLVGSLHCEQINPYIQLQDTPFYLVKHNQAWSVVRDKRGHALPRRAGVSSFGFGGVNAHVVVEEYIESRSADAVVEFTPQRPALIVLSAKNSARLREQASQLLAHLRTQRYSQSDLAGIAYTLQVGREAMECRLAFTATTLDAVQATLETYLGGQSDKASEECYSSEVKRNRETFSIFNSDDVLQHAVATWVAQGQYGKVLELWVRGLFVDWQKMYGEGSSYCTTRPKRMSLPTYPFAKEKYWVASERFVDADVNDNKDKDGIRTVLTAIVEDCLTQRISVDAAAQSVKNLSVMKTQ